MECKVYTHFVVMGLREKVALAILTITLTQLACSHCMPRTQTKTSLKSNLNTLKPARASSSTFSPTVQANSESKCLNVRNAAPDERSVFTTFNFPETEYPTNISPTNSFGYETHNDKPVDVVGKRTTNPQTEAMLNNLKKEMKLKRKLSNIKTEYSPSGREMTSTPTFNQDPLPHCFKNAGAFPEVEYPMSAMETWAPHYWNPTPFNDEAQQFDAFELPLQDTNIRANANPIGMKTGGLHQKSKPHIGRIEFAKSKTSNKTNDDRENFNTTVSSICESASGDTTDTGKSTSNLTESFNSSNTTHLSTLDNNINVIMTSNNTISFTPLLNETCPSYSEASATLAQDSYTKDIAANLQNVRNSELLEAISLILSSDNFDSSYSSPIPLPYKVTVHDIDICPAFDNITSVSSINTFDTLDQIKNPILLSQPDELNQKTVKYGIIDSERDQPFIETAPSSEDINVNSTTHSFTATNNPDSLLITFPLPLLAQTLIDASPDFLEFLMQNDTLAVLERTRDLISPQSLQIPAPNMLNSNLSQSGSIDKFPELVNISNTIHSIKNVTQNEPASPQTTQDALYDFIDTRPTDSLSSSYNYSLIDTVPHQLVVTPLSTLTNDKSSSSQMANIDIIDATGNTVDETSLAPTQMISNNGTTLSASIPLQIPQTSPIINPTIPSNIEVTVHHYHHLLNDHTSPPLHPVLNISSANDLPNKLSTDLPIFVTDASTAKPLIDKLTDNMPPPPTQIMPPPSTRALPSTFAFATEKLTNKVPAPPTQALPSTIETAIGLLTDKIPPPPTQALPSTFETATEPPTDKIAPLPTQALPSTFEIVAEPLTDKIPPPPTQELPNTFETATETLTDEMSAPSTQALPSTFEIAAEPLTYKMPAPPTQELPSTFETATGPLIDKMQAPPTQTLASTFETATEPVTDKIALPLTQALPSTSEIAVEPLTDNMLPTPTQAFPNTFETSLDVLTEKISPPPTQVIPNTTGTLKDPFHEKMPPQSTQIFSSSTENSKDLLIDKKPLTSAIQTDSLADKIPPIDPLTDELPPLPTQALSSTIEIATNLLTDNMLPPPTQALPSTTAILKDPLTGIMPPPTTTVLPCTTESIIDPSTDNLPTIMQAMSSKGKTASLSMSQGTPDTCTPVSITELLTSTLPHQKQPITTQAEILSHSIPIQEYPIAHDDYYHNSGLNTDPVVDDTFIDLTSPTGSTGSNILTSIDTSNFPIPLKDPFTSIETLMSANSIQSDIPLSTTLTGIIDQPIHDLSVPEIVSNYLITHVDKHPETSISKNELNVSKESSVISLIEMPTIEDTPLSKVRFSEEILQGDTSSSQLPTQLADIISGGPAYKSLHAEDIFVNTASRNQIPILDNSNSKLSEDEFLTHVDNPCLTNLAEELKILDTLYPNISEEKISHAVITPSMPLNGYHLTVQTEPKDNLDVPEFPPIINTDPSSNSLLSVISKPVDGFGTTTLTILQKNIQDRILDNATDVLTSNSKDGLLTTEISSPVTDALKDIPEILRPTVVFDTLDNDTLLSIETYNTEPFLNPSLSNIHTDSNQILPNYTFEAVSPVDLSLSPSKTDGFSYDDKLKVASEFNLLPLDVFIDDPFLNNNETITNTTVISYDPPIDDTTQDIPSLESSLSDRSTVDQIFPFNYTDKDVHLPYPTGDSLYDTPVSENPPNELPNLSLPNDSTASLDELQLPVDDITLFDIPADKLLLQTNDTLTDEYIDSSIHITLTNYSNIVSNIYDDGNTANYGLSDLPYNEIQIPTQDTFPEIPPFELPIVKNNPLTGIQLVSDRTRKHSDTSHETVTRYPMIDMNDPNINADHDSSISFDDKESLTISYIEDTTNTVTLDEPREVDTTNPDFLDSPTTVEEISSIYITLPENLLDDYTINENTDTVADTPAILLRLPTKATHPDLPLTEEDTGDSQTTTEKTNSENRTEDYITLDVLGDRPQDFSAEITPSQTTFLDNVSDGLPLSMHMLNSPPFPPTLEQN